MGSSGSPAPRRLLPKPVGLFGAVRGVAVVGYPDRRTGHLPVLRVVVDGWGGPIRTTDGSPCELRLPLEGIDVDLDAVGRLVRIASGGRLELALPAPSAADHGQRPVPGRGR